jgi:uncharacterized protein (UPF0332 family)
MTDSQLQLLVKYRLKEAMETLREAELLLNQSAFRGCINRSYYGMFYALLGLLATRGFGTSKHHKQDLRLPPTPPRGGGG